MLLGVLLGRSVCALSVLCCSLSSLCLQPPTPLIPTHSTLNTPPPPLPPGLVCDVGLTLGDLIGTLQEFFDRLGLRQLRFKPAYNPYTEPSMEIFRWGGLGCWQGVGCALCGGGGVNGWIGGLGVRR